MNAQIRQVSDEVYYSKSDGRITASMVKLAATKNLNAVREYLQGADQSSPAMRESWLCHVQSLEPEVWEENVVSPPRDLIEGITTAAGEPAKNPKATKAYAERLLNWEMAQGNKVVISDDEREKVNEIVAAYRNSDCYRMPTRSEIAIYYEFEGVPCKSKLDGLVDHEFGTDVVDLKFLRSTRGLGSTVFRYGYHIQMAMYLHAIEQAGMNPGSATIVAVDKTTRSSRDVVCSRLSEEAVQLGRAEAAYWVGRIAECMRTGHWPGNEAPPELEVPSWYRPSFLFQESVDI